MRHSNQAQLFTVFGGAFVAESHDHVQPHRTAPSVGPLAAVLAALLLGTATTAGAIATAKHTPPMGYGYSYKTIQAAGFEDAVY